MNDLSDFIKAFMESYRRLKPEEQNFFMEHFLNEVRRNKEVSEQSNFIDDFLKEIKEIENTGQKNDFIEEFISNVQSYLDQSNSNQANQTEQNQEQANIQHQEIRKIKTQENIENSPAKHDKFEEKFVLPLGWDYFNQNLETKLDEMFETHKKDLAFLGHITEQKIGNQSLEVFDRENVFSKEQILNFKKEYALSFVEALNKKIPNIDMKFLDINSKDEVIIQTEGNQKNTQEKFLELLNSYPINTRELGTKWLDHISIRNATNKNSNLLQIDFIQDLEKEYKEVSASQLQVSPAQENSQKRRVLSEKELEEPQYASLSDWFEKIKIEHKNFKLTKQDFKERFIRYCQNNMNEQEMKILLILANKHPSILNGEHRELIAHGLEAANTNSNLMDKGLQCCIQAQIGKKLDDDEKDLMKEYLKKYSNTQNPLDKKLEDVFAHTKDRNILSTLNPERLKQPEQEKKQGHGQKNKNTLH